MMLDRLLAGLDVRIAGGDPSRVRICDLTEDSRSVLPGSLFVARAGLTSDGRRFVADAVEAGAVAILTDNEQVTLHPGVVQCITSDVARISAVIAERFHGEPGSKLVVVGVTGTNGKSTVAHLVHRVLNRCGIRCGLIGTIEVDDGREVAQASMTTPPAIELSRTLATMVEAGCRAVVMEASSHALDQRRTDGLRFDAAIFTNLTHDHRDYHPTTEHYLCAKRHLFELLRENGIAIANIDDPAWADVVSPAQEVIRCSARSPADRTVQVRHTSLTGMELVLEGGTQRLEARGSLFGGYNAMNVLEALVACEIVIKRVPTNTAGDRFARAIRQLTAPAGRIERVSSATDDLDVFVDYAHTPDALASVLNAVREAGAKRVCAIIGCGGDRDREKRPAMGRIAAELADRIVITSDNPRRESPSAIVGQIIEGIEARERGRVEVHVDREHAIRAAVLSAVAGEVLVIAGKGHEKDQILPDPTHPGRVVSRVFDDVQVARDSLAQRRAQWQEASRA
jgi:UDP-N-acetylmuramoyl-L-alanyl-D-glutamate--2,6-diaminopimelate ligase